MKSIVQWELPLELPMTATLDTNQNEDDFILVFGAYLCGRNYKGRIESCADARQTPFVLQCDSYNVETSFSSRFFYLSDRVLINYNGH